MFELINDSFVFKENAGYFSSGSIVESEIYISDEMPNIEKIISINGKVKPNNTTVLYGKSAVYGNLTFDIVYRSNDEIKQYAGTSGKIDFMEEIDSPKTEEKMLAQTDMSIDYIDAEAVSDRKIKIKAVIDINVSAFNSRSIDYVSDIDHTDDFSMKKKTIKYTSVETSDVTDISIDDYIELDMNMDEIADVLKVDANAFVTSTDIMGERMLVEGVCNIGILYVEDNNFSSVNYAAKEFPFTHYVEVKDSNDDTLRKLNIDLKDLTYTVEKNDDLEKKIVEFDASFDMTSSFYKDTEKTIVTDGYSTSSNIELVSTDINIESIDEFKTVTNDYEKSFDILDGSVKDVYTVNIVPKVSETRIFDDKYFVEGFLDVDLLYLNGDINKVDGIKTNLPFNIAINLTDAQQNSTIKSLVKVNKYGCYRKNMSTVLINADIETELTFKSKKSINVLNNISDLGDIDLSEMPSLVFRVVQNGESLWDIAKSYNVSINYLKKVNNIEDEESLKVGDKILITRELLI